MGDGLWELLGQAAQRAGTDRAAAIRAWALWYAGITDELPDRPEPPQGRQDS